MKFGIRGWLVFGAVLALAGWTRFYDLGRAASRSDELNMIHYAQGAKTLTDLWVHPPWLNQMPLVDSIPVVWSRCQPWRQPDEAMTREPFALLGWLTVAFCTAWMIRRRGWCAGLLLGGWMAVLPYHVYHSREAYYYVLVMFFAAGMVLRGADFMARLRAGEGLRVRNYLEWAGWALGACLGHMCAWVVAGIAGALLAIAGWKSGDAAQQRRHRRAMVFVAVGLGLAMSRWVFRAFLEMKRTSVAPEGHFGSAFSFVGPRVLPIFAGGVNVAGILILLAAAAAVAVVFMHRRNARTTPDLLYVALAWLAGMGLAGSYAYIMGVGGAKAKLVYFSPNLPAFLAFAALSVDKAWDIVAPRRHLLLKVGSAVLLTGALLVPAWQVTQLTGKPTPYRLLRDWLDNNLPAGEVVVVDRWLEPWNEMALYAPSNVTVTFTVPDEPYEAAYVANRWRETTQAAFEQNEAQAFLRLSRNHEERVGLWKWPEKWFAHRAVVTNEAAVWLRDTGFAPMEEYYTQTNRVMPEIFYNTRAERAERAAAAGQKSILFFGAGWRLFKPWPQGDFANYQLLEHEASVTIYNLTGQAGRFRGEMVAAGAGGPVAVQVNDSEALSFPANRLTTQTFDIELAAGENMVTLRVVDSGSTLVVRRIGVTPQL